MLPLVPYKELRQHKQGFDQVVDVAQPGIGDVIIEYNKKENESVIT